MKQRKKIGNSKGIFSLAPYPLPTQAPQWHTSSNKATSFFFLLFFFLLCFVLFFFVLFGNRVSLYSPGWPGTHCVDQAGLELRNPPASAFQVLGLKACATTARWNKSSMKVNFGSFPLCPQGFSVWHNHDQRRILINCEPFCYCQKASSFILQVYGIWVNGQSSPCSLVYRETMVRN